MKPSSKAVMIGCISFFVFLYGNLLFGGLVGSLIPGGDDFINSYFYPLYTAVTLLISLIISCTYLIFKKINLLLDKMEEKETCVSKIGSYKWTFAKLYDTIILQRFENSWII